MTTLRIIDTGLADAARNLAVTESLADLHQSGKITDTLRLHRYHHAVLLGCHTPPDVVDAPTCARLGATVVRRISGGGAVAMEPGILAWDLLVTRTASQAPEDISRAISSSVASALAAFGVIARFRAPGDIVTDGQKIGGTAGFFDGLYMLHQGSLLVMPDIAEMAALLGQETLPVTTMALVSGQEISMQAVSTAIAAAICAGLKCNAMPDHLTAEETVLAEQMMRREVTA